MRNAFTFLACAAFGLLGTALQAQEYRVTSKVPFSFIVSGRTCPAGPYALQAQSYQNFEYLKNLRGKCSLFVNSRRILLEPAGNAHARLIFHRYGNSYFLSQVWNGQGTGSVLPVSERERKMQELTSAPAVATAAVELNGQ